MCALQQERTCTATTAPLSLSVWIVSLHSHCVTIWDDFVCWGMVWRLEPFWICVNTRNLCALPPALALTTFASKINTWQSECPDMHHFKMFYWHHIGTHLCWCCTTLWEIDSVLSTLMWFLIKVAQAWNQQEFLFDWIFPLCVIYVWALNTKEEPAHILITPALVQCHHKYCGGDSVLLIG